MRYAGLFLLLSTTFFFACEESTSGQGPVAGDGGGFDAGSTTTDPDGGTAADGAAPAGDSGITSCGAEGPLVPSGPTVLAVHGFEGYWQIDDAASAGGCPNGASILIGYPSAAPDTTDSTKNACAIANGRLLPYDGFRTKACFGPLYCIPKGSEIGFVVDPNSKIASIFEYPNQATKGKYLGSASLLDDGKLKILMTAGGGGQYIRGGGNGTCDP